MTKQVLIVEDDHILRRLFREVLIHFDCEVTEAATLIEANTFLDTKTFDFVMCDIHMREGKALGIVDKCRETDLAVIVISSDDSYVKLLSDSGALAFVIKPIHIPDLVDMVKNFEELQPYRTIRYPR